MNELIEEIIEDRFEGDADYAMKNPILFGDYRNALEDESERLYEDILDYDASKALFQEVRPVLLGILEISIKRPFYN